MPMVWNSEADAKLLLGIFNQLRDAKLKLDIDKLAAFMGSDCLPGAVQNRLVRLRKKAEETPDANANTGSEEDKQDPNSPGETSQKRKRGRPRSSKKKAKTEDIAIVKEKTEA
ncbi:hypothetical protein P175DRAFT_0539748 [Aspergillus ochraceoroseus IBT 24754]|uniref:AT hook motif protein n=1 Tax=Aspergillus ochraceoroseus IBT 24754 TaxID=1392256 RepID=A0A2T5M9Z6_9EURO|nr:uncharacterized protein P175DRAFT_0539748 [Aspergillus ochraceoroseus IBT 24754]PTU25362.1 hypothetical protein P175DRAFT_0539748 [Aspergillus ochraceoroseus IBT 24754]